MKPKDFFLGRTDAPMRFEIEVELKGKVCEYVIAFDLPEGLKELRVLEEKLAVGGQPVYTRKEAGVQVENAGQRQGSVSAFVPLSNLAQTTFRIDWHLVALPLLQERSREDPLFIFKEWLARILILRPIPSLITGESVYKALEPNTEVTDFGAWFSGLLATTPAAYAAIDRYLKQVMPDLKDIKNPAVGKDSGSLVVQFSNGQGSVTLPFRDLSDGEKCFMICAMVLAANDAYGPLLCFRDEPDNHLAISEVAHFVLALRKGFQSGGQVIMTSHNPEAIQSFSDENMLLLHRKSHLEPTTVRPLSAIQVSGDLVSALTRGDVEP